MAEAACRMSGINGMPCWNLRDKIVLNPSFSVLVALIAGVMIYFDCTGMGLWTIVFPGAFFTYLLLCGLKRESAKFAIFLVAGLLACWNANRIPAGSYLSLIGGGDCSAEIELRISDMTSTGTDIEWLPAPRPVKAEVIKLRFSSYDEWRDAKGTVVVFLPKESSPPPYDALYRAKGVFLEPGSGLFPGDFDYKGYLQTRGIRKIFRAEKLCPLDGGERFSMLKFFVETRNFILLKICDGAGGDPQKKVLAAIISGCKQGIDNDTRDRYYLSGMIHVLVVSGLQVGMLALTLFWIFRGVPFSARYILVPILILIYTASTDFQPSVVRAFFMIGIWCVFRAFFISVLPLNTIFLAASVMLILNPFSLFDRGFQFSFTVTIFLVLSWTSTRSFCEAVLEKFSLVPHNALSWRRNILSKSVWYFVPALSTTLTAWLASSPICLYYQGLMVPASLPANFAAIPLGWLLFIVSIFKFIFYPFVFIAYPANLLLEYSVRGLDCIAELASKSGYDRYFASPPALEILVFYLIFIFLFTVHRRWLFMTLSVLMIGMLMFWNLRERFSLPIAAVFYGGECATPMIVLKPEGDKNPTIVNASSTAASRSASNWLFRQGVGNVKCLLLCSAGKDCSAGTEIFLKGLNVGDLVLPPDWRRSPYGRKNVKTALENGVSVEIMQKGVGEDLEFRSQGLALTIELCDNSFCAKSADFSVSMRKDRGGRFNLEIHNSGTKVEKMKILPQNRLEMKELKFK